jgi:hypothetical protein
VAKADKNKTLVIGAFTLIAVLVALFLKVVSTLADAPLFDVLKNLSFGGGGVIAALLVMVMLRRLKR